MSYGFEFRDAAGIERLRITEALPAIIHQQRIGATWSGTISVPNFDSNHGMFYVSPCAFKGSIDQLTTTGFKRADSTGFRTDTGGTGWTRVCCHPTPLPTLSWNNSTKVMTVTAMSFPGGWPFGGNTCRPDYYLVFLRLHQRFTVT